MAWRAVLTPTIQELRFLLCPEAGHTQGCSSFIKNQYDFIKSLNPSMPFLVRETDDKNFKPKLLARYAYGVVHERCLENKSEEEVAAMVKELYLEGTKLPGIGPLPLKDII